MISAEIPSFLRVSATSSESPVFPVAVAPAMTSNGGTRPSVVTLSLSHDNGPMARQDDALPTQLDAPQTRVPVRWSSLPTPARAFRIVHDGWSIVGLSSLGYVWASALARRRDRTLMAAIAFLLVEGGALVVGRGNCPLGPQQAEWGDPVPFFELVLSPRAAKAAVPILALATIAGLTAVVLRRPKP